MLFEPTCARGSLSIKSHELAQVFRTPFQSAPLDLGTDAFFPAREALIMSRLKEIRQDYPRYELLLHGRDIW